MLTSSVLDSDTCSPIFVGGQKRSGTTLMRVMLDRHPHIAAGGESHLLQRTSFREFHDHFRTHWLPRLEPYGLGEEDLDRAFASFIDNFFIQYLELRGKRRWAEKTPQNIRRIDYLMRLFPRAQFIHMIRDPRDVHCSVRAKAMGGTTKWLKYTASDTARSWVRAITRGRPWRVHPDRYMEVRYEALAREPAAVMRDVFQFLGEPWDEQVLAPGDKLAPNVSRDNNVNRPVFDSSIGRWRRDLSQEDIDRIETVARDCMREMGYTLSRDVCVSENP